MNLFSMLFNKIGALSADVVGKAAEKAAEKATAADFCFEPMNFVKTLQYMGVGMLVIFILIGIIILSTLLINKIFSKKK